MVMAMVMAMVVCLAGMAYAGPGRGDALKERHVNLALTIGYSSIDAAQRLLCTTATNRLTIFKRSIKSYDIADDQRIIDTLAMGQEAVDGCAANKRQYDADEKVAIRLFVVACKAARAGKCTEAKAQYDAGKVLVDKWDMDGISITNSKGSAERLIAKCIEK
jgi:hypothetical protein